jgi:hypothetical protein
MHRSPDWLFVRSYTVDIDGNKFQIPLELRDRKSENTHEYCWEWSSHLADPTNVNDEVLQICKMLKDCRSATIFYHGDQYRDEYKLSASDTHEIGTVMEYWRCNSTNQAR